MAIAGALFIVLFSQAAFAAPPEAECVHRLLLESLIANSSEWEDADKAKIQLFNPEQCLEVEPKGIHALQEVCWPKSKLFLPEAEEGEESEDNALKSRDYVTKALQALGTGTGNVRSIDTLAGTIRCGLIENEWEFLSFEEPESINPGNYFPFGKVVFVPGLSGPFSYLNTGLARDEIESDALLALPADPNTLCKKEITDQINEIIEREFVQPIREKERVPELELSAEDQIPLSRAIQFTENQDDVFLYLGGSMSENCQDALISLGNCTPNEALSERKTSDSEEDRVQAIFEQTVFDLFEQGKETEIYNLCNDYGQKEFKRSKEFLELWKTKIEESSETEDPGWEFYKSGANALKCFGGSTGQLREVYDFLQGYPPEHPLNYALSADVPAMLMKNLYENPEEERSAETVAMITDLMTKTTEMGDRLAQSNGAVQYSTSDETARRLLIAGVREENPYLAEISRKRLASPDVDRFDQDKEAMLSLYASGLSTDEEKEKMRDIFREAVPLQNEKIEMRMLDFNTAGEFTSGVHLGLQMVADGQDSDGSVAAGLGRALDYELRDGSDQRAFFIFEEAVRFDRIPEPLQAGVSTYIGERNWDPEFWASELIETDVINTEFLRANPRLRDSIRSRYNTEREYTEALDQAAELHNLDLDSILFTD